MLRHDDTKSSSSSANGTRSTGSELPRLLTPLVQGEASEEMPLSVTMLEKAIRRSRSETDCRPAKTKQIFGCSSWSRWSPRTGRLREGWELRPTFADPALCKQIQGNSGPRMSVRAQLPRNLNHPRLEKTPDLGATTEPKGREETAEFTPTTAFLNFDRRRSKEMASSSVDVRKASKNSNISNGADFSMASKEMFIRKYSKDLNSGIKVHNCGMLPMGSNDTDTLRPAGSKDHPKSGTSDRSYSSMDIRTGPKNVRSGSKGQSGYMDSMQSGNSMYSQELLIRRASQVDVSKEPLSRKVGQEEEVTPQNKTKRSSVVIHTGSKDTSIQFAIEEASDGLQDIYDGSRDGKSPSNRSTNSVNSPSAEEKATQRNGTKDSAPGKSALKGSQVACMRRLSFDLNCPIDTVKDARQLFQKFASTGTEDLEGELSREAFERLMLEMLEDGNFSEDAKHDRVMQAWRQADRNRNNVVDFEEFAIWFNSRAFDEEVSHLLTEKQIQSRELARKYNLSVGSVDTVFVKFQQFDIDGNGTIDPEEFEKLLVILMKIPSDLELPPSRVKQFWNEADLDGNGILDFEEFLQWYIKYFDITGQSSNTPIENMYKSLRPEIFCHESMIQN